MNTKYPSIWLRNGLKIFETELQWISSYELVRNFLFFVFFVFKGLWWKFFGAFGAWICRDSLICDFLKFLEAFELNSSELRDLGRWFGWFLFKCSLYSRVYGESSSQLLGLESVEFCWSVVSWSFWRLLGLIPTNFEI